VEVADEAGVDQGDPVTGRGVGEEASRFGSAVRRADVEPQGPQMAFEWRSGYRGTCEDGGRQTNSLLGTDRSGCAGGGTSAEAIG
jgi:hypothetical protein